MLCFGCFLSSTSGYMCYYRIICQNSLCYLCRLRHRPPCVAVAITSYGSSDRSSGLCQPSPYRRWTRPVAVCPECGCTFGVGRSTLRPRHTSATGAALASGSTSGGFQDGHPGIPVTVRHGSSLSGRRLSVCVRRIVVSCVLTHQGRTLRYEPTATMDTGVLRLQV